MPRLKIRRTRVLISRLPKTQREIISEPTEEDETDHLIEEWIGEALGRDH